MNSLQAIELLNQVIDNINDRTLLLTNMLSEYDLQEQDILHYIENTKLNAVKTAQIFRLLREIRTKRRDTKDELNRYRSMQTKITSGSVLTSGIKIKPENTFYEVRTDVLFNISGYSAGSKMYFGEIPSVSTTEVKEKITESTSRIEDTKTNVVETDAQDDTGILEVDDILAHPEGKRIIMTNLQTGIVTVATNFEAAVRRAVGSRFGSIKSVELIKNVSGIMKAIKLGNDYLGYRWEVQSAQS